MKQMTLDFPEMDMQVFLRQGPHGEYMPKLEVTVPKGTEPGVLRAALHMLVATAELAGNEFQAWTLKAEPTGDNTFELFLELVIPTLGQAERGCAFLLNKVKKTF